MQPQEALASVVCLLATVDRPGDYYATGTLETSIPRIDVEGVGALSFPITAHQARDLVTVAEQAPYGRGGRTLVDPAVRKVWQVAADRIRVGSRWGETLDAIVAAATTGLGVDGAVHAELYKLLVYDPGSFFLEHRDSEKADGMFATLVVVLPSVHAGGELVLRHGDRSVSLDLGTADAAEVAWAAFYADCLHELRPVTEGHRVCLVYNLVRRGGQLTAPDHEAAVVELTATLQAWATAPDDWPTKVAFALQHHYTPAGLSFARLKSADRGVASVVVEAARRASCVAHLAMVAITETGSAEENHDWGRWSRRRTYDDDHFEVIEVSERRVAAEGWATPEGLPSGLDPIPVVEGEIWPPDALVKEKPDEQHYHEATGNEGAEFERTYRRAALVLWPSDGQLAVIAQAGPRSTVPLLERLVGHAADRDVALELARRTLDHWGPARPRYGSWRWDTGHVDPAQLRARMLQCLVRLRAPAEIERFVDQVVVETYDRDQANAPLVAAATLLEPTRAASLIGWLVRSASPRCPETCVDLLDRLISAGLAEVATGVASALVDAMVGNPEGVDPRPWLRGRADAKYVAALFHALWRLEGAAAAERAADRATAWYAVDEVLLPAALALAPEATGKPGWQTLRTTCVDHVSRRVAEPIVAPTDLARPAQWPCACKDCVSFRAFLASPTERTWTLKAAERHRQHVEGLIGQHRVDVDRTTIQRTNPRTLECTKNSRSHDLRVAQRAADTAALARLGGGRPAASAAHRTRPEEHPT